MGRGAVDAVLAHLRGEQPPNLVPLPQPPEEPDDHHRWPKSMRSPRSAPPPSSPCCAPRTLRRGIRAIDALVAGGVTGIEITYSTPDAAAVIREVRASTATTSSSAPAPCSSRAGDEAVEAGAEFLVSPGTDAELAAAMLDTGVTVLSGALTPSEVMAALACGVHVVKLFPASLGGPAYLKALRGPFPHVDFVPTGGVNAGNLAEWLAAGAVAVGAGGELCPAAAMAAGDWDAITATARRFPPRRTAREQHGMTRGAEPTWASSGSAPAARRSGRCSRSGPTPSRLPTRTLVGHDVALDSPPQVYREVVAAIRDDPEHWGALVTTHKMAVHAAARDLFDACDELAETFGEISCIAKRGDRLVGSAKDPVTARLALEEFLAPDHFARTGGAALILGSGGAGTALSHQLGVRADRPERDHLHRAEPGAARPRPADARARGLPAGLVRYVLTAGPDDVDALVAALPPASLVVNATGMGKDRPGSPVSAGARFPERGVVWEFNYRGPLDFWHQALAQQHERRLHVEDGWRYFVHGWSQAVAEVFDIPMPAETVDELGRIAARLR